MSFVSNVQPKLIKKPAPEPWFCHHCNRDVSPWHKRCPACRQPRK